MVGSAVGATSGGTVVGGDPQEASLLGTSEAYRERVAHLQLLGRMGPGGVFEARQSGQSSAPEA